jgi:hypothetical protein
MSDRLDGQLDPDQERLLAEHIAACGDCRREWEELRQTVELFRGLEPVAPRDGLLARVHARLEKKRHLTLWQMLSLPQTRVAIAAGLVAVVGLYGLGEMGGKSEVRGQRSEVRGQKLAPRFAGSEVSRLREPASTPSAGDRDYAAPRPASPRHESQEADNPATPQPDNRKLRSEHVEKQAEMDAKQAGAKESGQEKPVLAVANERPAGVVPDLPSDRDGRIWAGRDTARGERGAVPGLSARVPGRYTKRCCVCAG